MFWDKREGDEMIQVQIVVQMKNQKAKISVNLLEREDVTDLERYFAKGIESLMEDFLKTFPVEKFERINKEGK